MRDCVLRVPTCATPSRPPPPRPCARQTHDRSKGCDNRVLQVSIGGAPCILRSPKKAPEAQPHIGHQPRTQAWLNDRLADAGAAAPRVLALSADDCVPPWCLETMVGTSDLEDAGTGT